jgi:hypothetical protein
MNAVLIVKCNSFIALKLSLFLSKILECCDKFSKLGAILNILLGRNQAFNISKNSRTATYTSLLLQNRQPFMFYFSSTNNRADGPGFPVKNSNNSRLRSALYGVALSYWRITARHITWATQQHPSTVVRQWQSLFVILFNVAAQFLAQWIFSICTNTITRQSMHV